MQLETAEAAGSKTHIAHGDGEEQVCAGEGSLGEEDCDLHRLQREGTCFLSLTGSGSILG